jgi:hypothetical protein
VASDRYVEVHRTQIGLIGSRYTEAEALQKRALAIRETTLDPVIAGQVQRLEASMKRLQAIMKLIATESAPATNRIMVW